MFRHGEKKIPNLALDDLRASFFETGAMVTPTKLQNPTILRLQKKFTKMLVFEKFTYFIKFLPTEVID